MNQNNGYGVASLVCGILSLCTVWVGYFAGIILGVVAIVLSTKSKQEVGSNGLATGGLVTGIIGLVYCIPVTICSIACSAAICAAGL